MPEEFGAINIISLVAYLVLAPFVGGLLAGLDRKILCSNARPFRSSDSPAFLRCFQIEVTKEWNHCQ